MQSALETATAANMLFALLQKVEPGSDLLIAPEGSAYSWTSSGMPFAFSFALAGKPASA
jgi:hypothetical protein